MKQIKYSRILMTILLCMALVIPFFANFIPVNAAEPAKTIGGFRAYIDEENYICIETYDRVKASNIYYQTIGFSISRCALNEQRLVNGVNSEWVDMLFKAEQRYTEVVTNANGVQYEFNIFRIPLSDLIDQIEKAAADNPSAGYDEWVAEIENYYYHYSEDKCYLKFDSIMITINNGVKEGILIPSGYHFNARKTVYFNRPIDAGANPHDIQYAYGWRDRSGLETHFNKYLDLGDTHIGDEEIELGEPVALYETMNYSSNYDISTAIPSGEDVTNKISAAAFTGSEVPVSTVPVQQGGYSITYHYYWNETVTTTTSSSTRRYLKTLLKPGTSPADRIKELVELRLFESKPEKYYILYQADGSYIVWEKITTTNTNTSVIRHDLGTETYNYVAEVQFSYVSAPPQIYEFDSMTVYNQAFPGGSIDERKVTYTAGQVNMPDVDINMHLFNQHAASIGQPYMTLSDGMTVNGINYSPNIAEHCDFAALEVHSIVTTVELSSGDAATLNAQKAADRLHIANMIANNCWSRNDYVSINDGETNFVLMKSDKVNGAVVYDANNLSTPLVVKDTAATSANTGYGRGSNVTMSTINNSLLARRVGAQKTLTIPFDTDNEDFPTSCECTWESMFTDTDANGERDKITLYAGRTRWSGAAVDDIYSHVMAGGVGPGHREWQDSYPIRVHTPVISPIKIVNPDRTIAMEQTQLIEGHSYNPYVDNQLLLNKSYFIQWENTDWTSALYGDVEGEGYDDVLDRYVKDKYMRFPFDVVYNNTLYECDASTGYTPWILIQAPADYEIPYDAGVDVYSYQSANHWQMTPFYIPSFAEEGGEPGNNVYIECKVEAYNVEGRDLGNHTSAVQLQGNLNSQSENYVASSRKDVQLSGWIYDFTIVGSGNGVIYNGEGFLSDNIYDKLEPISFAEMKKELKSGTLNRLGTPYIRYLTDGSVTDSWDPNRTVPLRNGHSGTFAKMGNAYKGQPFAYTIKTISNLNGPNDSLEITPTFTYVTSDGEVLSSKNGDFKMYVFATDHWYEYNPNDTSLSHDPEEVTLSHGMFKESYYDEFEDANAHQFGDWLTSSVENENSYNVGYGDTVTNQEYFYRKVLSYDLNHISIPAELRYISGEYEQLERNQSREYERGGASNLLTYHSINGYGASQEADFIKSMQQWQSMYLIPENIKIVDVRDKGGDAFNLVEYSQNKPDFSLDDEIFEQDDGYLVINFDIKAYKDGEPYLQYSGGYGGAVDMWDREGYIEDPLIDPGEDPNAPQGPIDPMVGPEIPIVKGDVVVVDLSRQMHDWYEAAIHNIN